jgi:hypothetical protein
MGLWRRLFGGSTEKGDPVEPSFVAVELVPGALSARVWAHTFRSGAELIPCWTYVTEGLPALGQKEFVFTLRRLSGEKEHPPDPLPFFAQVHGLAAKGQLVDVGGFTCFRSAVGFLGIAGLVGLAYTTTETLPGVQLPPPDQALLAILLTPEEATVVPTIGTYRVLSLLGQTQRYYPCPPWSDRRRPSVLSATDLQGSLLGGMSTLYVRGGSARTFLQSMAPAAQPGEDRLGTLSGRGILLRLPADQLPRLQEAFSKAPDEGAVALLLDPDPEANVRLVWRPEQKGVQTITPAASDGSCLTGGFLALVFGPSIQDSGRIVEDGFGVMLSTASWGRVREALLSGKPVRVPAVEPETMDFGLEWLPPRANSGSTRPAEQGSSPFQLVESLLYQPDEVLRQRMPNSDAFLAYVKRVLETAAAYWTAQPVQSGQTATLVLAVKPGGRSRFWLDLDPGGLAPEAERNFLARLEELTPPVVQHGPVAMAFHATLWGGRASGWEFLPREWQQACQQGGQQLLVPDGILPLVWPD